MKAAGRPIVAALRGRGYVAQAAVAAQSQPMAPLAKQDVKVSRMPNGAIVASLENNSPLSRVAFVYNAGARYEDKDTNGITHCIRNAACLSNDSTTSFGLTRGMQQLGGSLLCANTRERMIYSTECIRSNIWEAVKLLQDAATRPSFKVWELKDANERLNLELALLQEMPHVRLNEALHKAAFRRTLGNSLYMAPERVGLHSTELLRSFVKEHFTSGNLAIVGVGVDHDELLYHVKRMRLNEGGAPSAQPAQYGGGEVRIETPSPLVHAAIVTEAPSFSSKEAVTVGLLQKVIGAGRYMKYGSNVATSKIMKAAGQGTSKPYTASSIYTNYSDAGFFGFQVVGHASDIDGILKSVVESFGNATKGGITDADVQRGKAQLKAALHMEFEDSDLFMHNMGIQTLIEGSVRSAADFDAAIDAITTADVQAVAKKVINGKPSMAAVGDLYATPYLDQLL